MVSKEEKNPKRKRGPTSLFSCQSRQSGRSGPRLRFGFFSSLETIMCKHRLSSVVERKKIHISLEEIHIPAGEIHKSPREIPISAREIHISFDDLCISLSDLCKRRPEPTTSSEESSYPANRLTKRNLTIKRRFPSQLEFAGLSRVFFGAIAWRRGCRHRAFLGCGRRAGRA